MAPNHVTRFRFLALLASTGVACAMLSMAWASPASAQAAVGTGDTPVDPGEVRRWLLRIHEAASTRNFQGTFVVSGGGAVSSARIAHFCEGKNQFERSESLDGQARHVYRHNEQVYTVWPARRIAVVEQRDALASFPALLQTSEDRIADFYEVHLRGTDRVAGHEASVLLVRPKDGKRYGYRLWADQTSGLLLRADVVGLRGEVLETAAFSDVVIGVRPQPESVLQPLRRLDGYRVLRPVMVPTRLDVEGWTLAQPAPGFRQVSCVKRPMDGAVVGDPERAGEPALQTIYSDGLTYVSVFIEPFNAEHHTREMLASVGATQTMMQRRGNWWVTVVGDVPPATLRMFANSLERKN